MRLFERVLRHHEQVRHAELLRSSPPRHPEELRDPDDHDGFLPVRKAAAVMSVSEDALLEMVGRGQLEEKMVWGEPFVRPAVVSVLGVKDSAT